MPPSTEEELRLSLRRLAAAGDAERRRLERELHDGALQRLVAVRVKLGLLRDLVPSDDETVRRFDELESGLHDAFRALRELAHDIYPAVLAAEGPAAALRGDAERCPVPVRIDATAGRQPPEIESAVYYSCAEALRRADGARVAVQLEEDGGDVVFTLTGGSFDGALESIEDRVRAVGGRLDVEHDGQTTTLRGRLPLSN